MSHQLYGLIGKKLSHSFSQKYFRQKFQDEGINGDYLLYELSHIDHFPSIISKYPGLRGLNVTIPYKSEVIPFLDELDPAAAEIGAVNTILVRQGRLTGFNTDVYGFERSLKKWLDPGFKGNALILGTGGAAKAANWVLSQWDHIGTLKMVSRNPSGENQIAYGGLKEEQINAFHLIVNCTPLGMYPNEGSSPPIPYDSLTADHYLYDMVYNPEETLFMRLGLKAGASVKNGLEMLHLQAEKAWEIWNM